MCVFVCMFCASESEAGINVTLDMSFSEPVNISSLNQALFLMLTNHSFAVDLSSLTVTRKFTHLLLAFVHYSPIIKIYSCSFSVLVIYYLGTLFSEL